jgi:hypothetical protein
MRRKADCAWQPSTSTGRGEIIRPSEATTRVRVVDRVGGGRLELSANTASGGQAGFAEVAQAVPIASPRGPPTMAVRAAYLTFG